MYEIMQNYWDTAGIGLNTPNIGMAAPIRWFLLGLALTSTSASILDTQRPIIFQDRDRSFGHQVVQLEKRVIVSAPRYPVATNKTGRLYDCNPVTSRCSPIPITGSDDDIDISLGLSLATRENPGQLLACGPTLQRSCGQNIYVNGRCYQLDQSLRVQGNLSAPPPECGLDLVFVIDGSGSVSISNFRTMLSFVRGIISSLSATDTQFALIQYSEDVTVEFTFRRFSTNRDLTDGLNIRYQDGGYTRTRTAILKAINDLFIPLSRKVSRKLLIVITDGQSNGETVSFRETARKAEELGIQRISIGVGASFTSPNAYKELQYIASSSDSIYQVNDFSALNDIQKKLQQKIFAIEGTESLTGQSFEMEYSQEGFSGVITPDGALLGAVGAYGWTGGAYNYQIGQDKATFINVTEDNTDMKDSYLGYSVLQIQSDVIAMGAPRYQHTGKVLVFRWDAQGARWNPAANVLGDQIGSYFGSALSMVKTSSSDFVLVVGAPSYYSPVAPGGRVYLCPVSAQAMNSQRSRNTITCRETLQDLAVGAPFENDGQGALYIFPGKDGGFRTSRIQRIEGSKMGSGVQFFGRSLAGNLDMTNDGLPDVTVGGEGVAVILRSRPVLQVTVSMTFKPLEFPLSSYECTDTRKQQVTEINVCFNQRLKSIKATGDTMASVEYNLLLDARRTQNRAVFSGPPVPKVRELSLSRELRGPRTCDRYEIILPECVEDSLTPLRVSLNFSLIGNPVLSENSQRSHSGEISFEKNCGVDSVCRDNLSMNLTFSGLQHLVVGLFLDVNLTVSVTNKGDDSYNSRVLIPFPQNLSYRRVSLLQSNKRVTITCSTLDTLRTVSCGVNHPLLRPNTTAIFLVSFYVAPSSDLGDSLTMTANVTSDNNATAPNDQMKSSATIKVLYSIFVTITSLEESSKYENFTSPEPSINHIYRVTNQRERLFPLSVTFLIPVRLGESVIWETPNITNSKPWLTKCMTIGLIEGAKNYRELLKASPVLNCSVGTCLRTDCNISSLEKDESVTFTISGLVTKDWEMQTEQKKISLQSSAEIHYDLGMYFMEQNFTKAQAQSVLEVIVQYNYLPIIIGSSIGGLVLLALITAGLYKLGFFKRQYKQMLEDTDGETAGEAATTDPPTNHGPE
ncbi:integrin alpha-X-like isoform X2 [Ranitomeya variabilis]|uniref:integrin alpha-X-like isoform X2 n=1 Tax=Ranitomeya variabilis TaxID=490064 RepID=UPI0040578C7D